MSSRPIATNLSGLLLLVYISSNLCISSSSFIEGTVSISTTINSNDNQCIEQQSEFKAQNAIISSSILDLSDNNECDTCYEILCTDLPSICNAITPSIAIKIIDSYSTSDTDFKLTPDAFEYITEENISANIDVINVSYTPIPCDNLNIPNDLDVINEYVLAANNTLNSNSTDPGSKGHDEGWASVFGTVIIIIIATVCCCCGFGCVYRRYLEKAQLRNNSEVPDKSRASRTSARHSEREHTATKSSKKREYSRTITNTWDKTRKKVAEMVEKSKTISKPAMRPMGLNNLKANLNEFDDDDIKYAYDDEDELHQDPEIIEEQLQALRELKLNKHASANSDASITAFSVTPLTYQTQNELSIDFAMDTPKPERQEHASRPSIIAAIPEERASELSSTSSGLHKSASLALQPSNTNNLTLAPTNSDAEPTQTLPNITNEVTETVTQMTQSTAL